MEYRGKPDALIATITLSNPDALNALTTGMQLQLIEKLQEASDNPNVRGVIFRGAGERAFSAGGSMDSLAEINSPAASEEMYRRGVAIRDGIMNMRKPVVAAVTGWCIGGGFEIALSCDLIYASEDARFGMTEVDIGLVPGWGGAIRLPRRTNLVRAKEMLLLGTRMTALEACQEGIINRVVPKPVLFDYVDKVMDQLASKPPLAVQGIKEIVSIGALDTRFEDAREIEHRLSIQLMGSHDFREAVDAFQNKREPHFTGE
jgi:enoyl-CoA hydratase/carnithine racemase